jgi:hypothetical protein
MNIKNIAKILEEDKEYLVRPIILDKAQKEKQIIYGARAINIQLPKYLEKETKDYDILTKKPKRTAKEVITELNRRVGREEFKLVKAKHKGTYKIKDSKGKTVVDYTQLKTKPKSKKVWGNQYYDIKSIKRNVSRLVKKSDTEYRRDKDLETLKKIKLSEDKFILN